MTSTINISELPSKPPIRWAGGKSRLLKHIEPQLPEEFADYYEPFLGGGAVFMSLRGRISRGVLSDLNGDLVAFWTALRDEPLGLLEAHREYVARHSEEFYYEVRGQQHEDPLRRAAHFLYLNQSAWNGLYRVNRFGAFNVPWGDRSVTELDPTVIDGYARLLADVDIRLADFREVLTQPTAGDLVYLDPPYLKVSDTSKFNGYTAGKFRQDDMAELARLCREMDERGVHWVLSNRDSDVIRGLFEGFNFIGFTVRRSIAAQNRRDIEPTASPELVVTNGPWT